MQMCEILMVGERGEETGARRIQSGIIQSSYCSYWFINLLSLLLLLFYYNYY